VITCKAGNKICRSLVITEAEFGKPKADSAPTFLKHDWISCLFGFCPYGEATNYKGVGIAREGGGGIPALPICDPLPSAHGPELAPNGRAIIFMLRPCETLP
ncbi:hypothetical protein H5410_031124, partial [Solanum commersonii]